MTPRKLKPIIAKLLEKSDVETGTQILRENNPELKINDYSNEKKVMQYLNKILQYTEEFSTEIENTLKNIIEDDNISHSLLNKKTNLEKIIISSDIYTNFFSIIETVKEKYQLETFEKDAREKICKVKVGSLYINMISNYLNKNLQYPPFTLQRTSKMISEDLETEIEKHDILFEDNLKLIDNNLHYYINYLGYKNNISAFLEKEFPNKNAFYSSQNFEDESQLIGGISDNYIGQMESNIIEFSIELNGFLNQLKTKYSTIKILEKNEINEIKLNRINQIEKIIENNITYLKTEFPKNNI